MRLYEIETILETHIADPMDDYSAYNPEDDRINHHSIDDTRKPTLTLKDLNRLKKMRSTKDLELSKKKSLLAIMYGIPEEAE